MPNRPYRPSWIDWLIDRIEQLPVHPLVIYLAGWVFASGVYHGAIWVDGALDVGEFDSQVLFSAVWFSLGLGLIHYFKATTRRALDGFAPAMASDPDRYRSTRYRMLHLPALPALIMWSIVAVAVTVAMISNPSEVFDKPLGSVGGLIVGVFAGFSFGFAPVLAFTVIRLLVLIRRAYRELPAVNVIHQRPLYALSNLTIRVGVLLLLVVNINLADILVFGDTDANAVDWAFVVGGLGVATATFLVPLWGVHRRLQDAKANMIEENAEAIDRTRVQLYAALGDEDHERVESLDQGLGSLFRIDEQLQEIPTWPWRPGTFRNFVTLVVLPIVAWISQQLLSDVF